MAFDKLKKKIGETVDGSYPTNQKLYAQIKSEAKAKFDRYPSARASQYIVKTYKDRGGEYTK
jgi:nitrogenase molybdenum-iron protein alpha/beta subunit